MTHQDLSAIAAYAYSEKGVLFTSAPEYPEPTPVDSFVLEALRCDIRDGDNSYTDFKIHLRPFHHITNEELKTCWALALPSDPRPSLTISRYDEVIYASHTDSAMDQMDMRIDAAHGYYSFVRAKEHEAIDSIPFAVSAYLQSISVYVPGSIDEQFVVLIGIPELFVNNPYLYPEWAGTQQES